MMNKIVLALLATTAAVTSARAAEAACTPPSGSGSVKTYWPTTSYTSTTDLRCDASGACRLQGWLYKPTGATKNMPMLVYIHGSGDTKSESSQCDFTEYFLSQGYVVWRPYMRGVDNSGTGGVDNTGRYIVDWVDSISIGNNDIDAMNTMSYMYQEVEDIEKSLTYVLSLPGNTAGSKLVDPAKIALSGHSYGGVTVSLGAAANMSPKPAVVISMSSAVLSWSSSNVWDQWLTDAARDAEMPMFWFQTTNEANTIDPALSPFMAADAFGSHPVQLSIFGEVPNISYANPACDPAKSLYQCAHTQFVETKLQIMRWAPQMVAFMKKWNVD